MYNASEKSPDVPGSYCVSFQRIRSLMAIYCEWDGQEWKVPPEYAKHGGTMYWYPN